MDKYVLYIYFNRTRRKLEAAASVFNDSTDVVKLGQEIEKANEIAMSYKRQAEAEQELSKLEIIGKSPSFLRSVSQALIVAKTEAPVLIKGENGVGKEVIAKAIHSNSERKTANDYGYCAAIRRI